MPLSVFSQEDHQREEQEGGDGRVDQWIHPTRQGTKRGGQDLFSIFEGDGSAWDTTCSKEIRSVTENPVIFFVAETLVEIMFEPNGFIDTHNGACTLDSYQLRFRCKKDRVWVHVSKQIEAIRRSGHIGTSALNWLINMVCWATTPYRWVRLPALLITERPWMWY